ncbi:hypothetical protein RUND412_001785 [Rhizina undulata]
MSTKVVIVGAGWSGLIAAKTYLQVDPYIDLTIIEADSSVGGVWSKERIYPTLISQTSLGNYEYSDLPMPNEGMFEGGYIPAERVHAYLHLYANRFDLLDRTRFNTKVQHIARDQTSKGWNLTIKTSTGEEEIIYADKLIISTGVTSDPHYPDVENKGFKGRVIHSKEIGKNVELIRSNEVSKVTVYGGSKSALDCVYLCAKAGKDVNWVIRRSGIGSGPSPIGPAIKFGIPLASFISMKFLAKWNPCILSTEDWWYRFLHSGASAIGTAMTTFQWTILSKSTLAGPEPGYSKSENGRKLMPEVGAEELGAFWGNQPAGIVSHRDFWPMVHAQEKIHVHRAEIDLIFDTSVNLSDGTSVPADLVIYATGYEVPQSIFSPEDCAKLGLPTPIDLYPQDLKEKWEELDEASDEKVLTLFPRLTNPPNFTKPVVKYSPYRLYRGILPAELAKENDRSLTFLGMVQTGSTAILTESSALWAVAWMTDNLDVPEPDIVEQAISEVTVWTSRRYLSMGMKCPFIVWETILFVDKLLQDLGVEHARKSNMVKELFSPYTPSDYRGIVNEWRIPRGM